MDDYPVLIVHSNSKIQKKICEPRMVKGSFKSVFFPYWDWQIRFQVPSTLPCFMWQAFYM